MRHMQPPPDAIAVPPGKPFHKRIATWNEWVGDAVSSRNRAWWVALAAIGLAGFAVHDASVERSKRQLRVHVVERDESGHPIKQYDAMDPRPLTKAQVAKRFRTWVRDNRSVLVDYTALRDNLTNGYATTKRGSAAYRTLHDFHVSDPPDKKAEQQTVYVFRETAIPAAGNTWQVDWCERRVSRDGLLLGVDAMRMQATYAIEKPTTQEAAMANPDGWFVVSFDWHNVRDDRNAVQTAAAASRSATDARAPASINIPEQCR